MNYVAGKQRFKSDLKERPSGRLDARVRHEDMARLRLATDVVAQVARAGVVELLLAAAGRGEDRELVLSPGEVHRWRSLRLDACTKAVLSTYTSKIAQIYRCRVLCNAQ